MTKRRGRAGQAKGQKETDAERLPPVIISPPARLLGDHFYTLLLVGGLLAVLVGWQIAEKLRFGTSISPLLWAFESLGLLLLALPLAGWLFMRAEVRAVLRQRRTQEEAHVVVRAARRSLQRADSTLDAPARQTIEAAASSVEKAQATGDAAELAEALGQLEDALDVHLPRVRRATAQANYVSIVIWVLAVLFFRSFVAEAFKIPSGSMIPTLQVGDQIFVNKFIYGLRVPGVDYLWPNLNWKFGMDLRKPRRGEVAVFKFPTDPTEDFIKRIVAVENDTLEIRDDVLHINGVPMPRKHLDGDCAYEDFDEKSDRWQHRLCEAWQETLGEHTFTTYHDRDAAARSWPQVKVPPRHVFVMGDNRDNSNDSRFWGFVPVELLRGKAMVVWWSSGEPEGIRLKRFGKTIE